MAGDEMDKLSQDVRTCSARPVYTDVTGASFKIGTVVRVWRLVDEEAEPSVLGKQGVVEYFEYSCRCGQSYPRDPMIGVRFPNGGLHEFWREELRIASTAASNTNLQRLKPR